MAFNDLIMVSFMCLMKWDEMGLPVTIEFLGFSGVSGKYDGYPLVSVYITVGKW